MTNQPELPDPATWEWYRSKIQLINGIDPYLVEAEKWVAEKTAYPPISHADIFNYLVLDLSAYTLEQFRCYKSLQAYNQAYNGFVLDVHTCKPDGCHNIILMGKVLHSQQLNAAPLKPWVVIAAEDNMTRLLAAHCTCMAGLGETCTHVAALLFYVEGWMRLGERVAVTGKAAYWSVPPGMNM